MLQVALSEYTDRSSFWRERTAKAIVVLCCTAMLPAGFRLLERGHLDLASIATMLMNIAAVIAAFWLRTSIRTYPGSGAGRVLLTTVIGSHAFIATAILAFRLPYDRVGLAAGLLVHLATLFAYFVSVGRRTKPVVGLVPFGQIEQFTLQPEMRVRVLSQPNLGEADGCSLIAADLHYELPPVWTSFLAAAALQGKIVCHFKQLEEAVSGRARIDHLSENTFGTLVPAGLWFQIKILIDWVLALMLLPVLLPFMAVIALGIRMNDGGPALFKQPRVGLGGRKFILYKFRTMCLDQKGECARQSAQTLENDPRVTPLGRWLRRTRLDELPQLFNILQGQMSFIGPRPEALPLSEWYGQEVAFYAYRHVVRPGITGWAQVLQGHVVSVADIKIKLEYDFYYIKHFSPWLDLVIALRTAKTMVMGRGAR